MTEPVLTESKIFAPERPEPNRMYSCVFSSTLLEPFFFFA